MEPTSGLQARSSTEWRDVRLAGLDTGLSQFRAVSEAQVVAMAAKLSSQGQLSPLVACRVSERLVLVDGFVRLQAAERMKWETVRVEVVLLSPVQMKAQLLLRNAGRGMSLLEECRLVHSLSVLEGLSQVEIAALFCHHKSWACRRVSLGRSLSPRVLQEGDPWRLSSGTLLKLAELQTRKQDGRPLREVWETCERHRLKGSELSGVLALYRRAPDEDARRYLLGNPREALRLSKAAAVVPQDPRLGKNGYRVPHLIKTAARGTHATIAEPAAANPVWAGGLAIGRSSAACGCGGRHKTQRGEGSESPEPAGESIARSTRRRSVGGPK